MNQQNRDDLAKQLAKDRDRRDRTGFDYTISAIGEGGIVWPESNESIYQIIRGNLDYNSLPMDESNEYHKGVCLTKQQDIIIRNNGKSTLCEALDMNLCLKEKCPLYDSTLAPPVCREYKMAFRK